MRKLLWVVGTACAAVIVIAGGYWFFGTGALAAQPQLTGKLIRLTGTIKGLQRPYVLYIPQGLKPGAPLLFMFHGSGGDGASTREVTGYGFDVLADRDKFLVVYPDGFETTWNDCRKASQQPAHAMNIDDESFIEAIIAQTAKNYGIDPKRVFAAGHSNGGQLAFRLALERPKEFAGIAAISASIPTPENLSCTKSDIAIPAMVINGTADPINPFNGGMVTLGPFTKLGNVTSTRATVEYFAKIDGQTGQPVTTMLPHHDPRDPTSVERVSWEAPGKPPVVMYQVNKGGHVVPNPNYEYPDILGRQTKDLDAPVAIWDFFSKLPPRQ
ncbi:MAG TPA: PHB depolymerase family esterase [Micropepsaceae bacterium]|nr:PHB depolymerase family esterase [Micropepsaceae bacterium]